MSLYLRPICVCDSHLLLHPFTHPFTPSLTQHVRCRAVISDALCSASIVNNADLMYTLLVGKQDIALLRQCDCFSPDIDNLHAVSLLLPCAKDPGYLLCSLSAPVLPFFKLGLRH